jgi:hypothetical protein
MFDQKVLFPIASYVLIRHYIKRVILPILFHMIRKRCRIILRQLSSLKLFANVVA